jgi:hypothetical protein
MSGFIIMHRKFLKWEWWNDQNTSRVFLYFLLNANWDSQRYEGKEIKRGELISSYPRISSETGLTISQVRTCISKLKSTKEISVQKAGPKNIIIQVIKYDLYQANDEQIASTQRANSEHLATTKQRNKGTKEQGASSLNEFNDSAPSRRRENSNSNSRKKRKVDPEHAEQAKRQSAESDIRWYELTKIWKTTEDPNTLHGNTRKKYWDVLGTEQQMEILEFVQSRSADFNLMGREWISSFFKDGGSVLFLEHKLDSKKAQSVEKSKPQNKNGNEWARLSGPIPDWDSLLDKEFELAGKKRKDTNE